MNSNVGGNVQQQQQYQQHSGGKTTVVINKNGSKTTTITESIIDKPVSDNSEDLKSPTGDVVIFPEFPTWDAFGPSIGGPGIKCQII